MFKGYQQATLGQKEQAIFRFIIVSSLLKEIRFGILFEYSTYDLNEIQISSLIFPEKNDITSFVICYIGDYYFKS